MLTAVSAAVVAAAAAFVIGVAVAIYVMLKAARLMTESSAAIAGLREREDLLVERAGAAIDRVGEQIAMTETVTASMDDVTASIAELHGRLTALTPAAVTSPAGPRGALTWGAALVYGFARALGLRWAAQLSHRHPARYLPRPGHPAQGRFSRRREPAAPEATARKAAGAARPASVTEQRRAALTGGHGGESC